MVNSLKLIRDLDTFTSRKGTQPIKSRHQHRLEERDRLKTARASQK
jgi:hypothetical protein